MTVARGRVCTWLVTVGLIGILAIAVAFIGSVSRAYGYDAPTGTTANAHVELDASAPSGPSQAKLSGSHQWSASPPISAQGTSTTSNPRSVATEAVDGPARTFTHFTDEAGAVGISGTKSLAVGDSVGVGQLSFAKGENPFLASEPGRVFVTDLGAGATPRQLEGIGVFGAKQQYAIEFSEADAFASGARVVGEVPSRGIYSIPGGCTINGVCTVTRVR